VIVNQTTHTLSFNGAILARGFWLYVWEIGTSDGKNLYYVGRTGDSSSVNAQSPFNRMGQHLGFNKNSNVLRRHLNKLNVSAEECSFRMVAHGPIQTEAGTYEDHCIHRDSIAALEKALTGAMVAAGYHVLNSVHCRKQLDPGLFTKVLAEFAVFFPNIGCS